MEGWGGSRLQSEFVYANIGLGAPVRGEQTRRGRGGGARRVRRPSSQQLSYYTPTLPGEWRRNTDLKPEEVRRRSGGRGAGQAKGAQPRASCS